MSIFRRTTSPAAPTAPEEPTAKQSPAISLTKLQDTAPGLVDLYKRAGDTMAKYGLAGHRAAVYLAVDHSASMRRHYRDGHVQVLAERVLAAAAHLDDDGKVPVVLFHGHAEPVATISLDNYQGAVERLHTQVLWGGTEYCSAMQAVIDHYQLQKTDVPAFVVFQTDGRTAREGQVAALLKDASRLPIFWKFVGFGDPNSSEFAFLRKLDKLRGREVDNAGFFAAGTDPAQMSDAQLYDLLMDQYPQWLDAARAKGIVP